MRTARTLQRVVFPPSSDPDVLPLYVEGGEEPLPRSLGADRKGSDAAVTPPCAVNPDDVLDRRRVRVRAGTRVSLATYINAFPASYWQRWTSVDAVELHVRVTGPARVAVYRSSAAGSSERVETARHAGGGEGELTFRLPLRRFVDGGWYWFDVSAGAEDVIVQEAEWRAAASGTGDAALPDPSGAITMSVTTFNRPGYLIELLEQLSRDPAVLDVVDEILVVDQGTQRVRDQSAFEDVAKALGGRLRVIEQANVGGSGGFARGMNETLSAGKSRYVLLMDDDVSSEPESILRAVAFADRCKRPTIVGGHMFDLYAPSRLHHFGEVVNPWRYHFTVADGVEPNHDFRAQSLRGTTWMHRRVDVDYNAWWMCLIPVEVLKTVGLALPIFIKWDDAEYGLRAKKAGFPTVTLPGVAIWHMPFTEKDDVLDWQAYFHQRNRFIAALLHSPYPRGGRLVRDSLYQQIRHLLALQYSVADLRVRALEDVLAGPEALHGQLATKLPEVRAVRATYADSTATTDPDTFPEPASVRLVKQRQDAPPEGRLGNLVAAATIGLQHLRPVRPESVERPQTVMAALDVHWWKLAQIDSALVSTLDGTSVAWYRRDRDRYVNLLRRSIRLHKRLLSEWPELSRRYREAADGLVSPATWTETFERLAEAVAAEQRT